MIIWGGAFAPLAHFWYGALDKMIPGKGALVVASKVAADQVYLLIWCSTLFAVIIGEATGKAALEPLLLSNP